MPSLNILARMGLPSRIPSACPTTAPATDATATSNPSSTAIGCWAIATASRSGSGGIGKKMDSANELESRTTMAQSLSANPRSQSERSCRRSLMEG